MGKVLSFYNKILMVISLKGNINTASAFHIKKKQNKNNTLGPTDLTDSWPYQYQYGFVHSHSASRSFHFWYLFYAKAQTNRNQQIIRDNTSSVSLSLKTTILGALYSCYFRMKVEKHALLKKRTK